MRLQESEGASHVREFPLPLSLLTPVTLSEYHYALERSLKLLKGAQTHKRLLVSYNAHKQPFVNLLYSYICISIVISAEYPCKWSPNKPVIKRMYVCMYVCKELCLCCFLTVSGQIISAILSSFDGLVFHLLIRGQEKTRLFYAARRKSSKNLICMYDRRSLVFERRQARPVARVWRYSLASCLPPLSLRTREKKEKPGRLPKTIVNPPLSPLLQISPTL